LSSLAIVENIRFAGTEERLPLEFFALTPRNPVATSTTPSIPESISAPLSSNHALRGSQPSHFGFTESTETSTRRFRQRMEHLWIDADFFLFF
jgi:hypothetical protein